MYVSRFRNDQANFTGSATRYSGFRGRLFGQVGEFVSEEGLASALGPTWAGRCGDPGRRMRCGRGRQTAEVGANPHQHRHSEKTEEEGATMACTCIERMIAELRRCVRSRPT
jgi:hypothetical protein